MEINGCYTANFLVGTSGNTLLTKNRTNIPSSFLTNDAATTLTNVHILTTMQIKIQ